MWGMWSGKTAEPDNKKPTKAVSFVWIVYGRSENPHDQSRHQNVHIPCVSVMNPSQFQSSYKTNRFGRMSCWFTHKIKIIVWDHYLI